MSEEQAEEIVRGTEGTLEEHRPGLADDDRADEERHDQDRDDDSATAECFHQRQGEAQADQELDGNVCDGQRYGDPERVDGDRIGDDLPEVLEAYERVAGNLEIVVYEQDPDREQQR